jgi:O-antigen/teichoic acid export membrane protein
MKYKIFAKQTILIFLANLFVGLTGIILLPILTRNLSIAEYGIWVQITVTVSLVPIFIVMGLPSYSMVRFLSGEQNKEKIQEGFYSIAFVILIIGLLVSSIFFIFAGQISQILFGGNSLIVKLLSLILILSSLNILFQYFFITFQQIKQYSLLLCLKAVTLILFVSFFILLGKGVIGAVAGFLCNEFIFFLIAFSLILSKIGIIFPKFTELNEYLHLSIPAIPSSLSYWVVDSSDRYLIGILLGASAVGYYSPGYSLGSIVAMLAAPITSILTSTLSKSYNEKNDEEVKNLMEYSIKYFLFIAIPSVIGLSLLSKPLLTLLSTSAIANAGYLITPFVAVGFLLLGLNNIIVNMIILEKKTKIIGFTWIIAATINLIFNLLLIPLFGILGAAIATLIAYTIPFIILAHYSFKFIKLNLNYEFYIKIILASLPIIFMYLFWKPDSLTSVLLFVLISVIIYLVSVMLLRAFNEEELFFIKSFFNEF